METYILVLLAAIIGFVFLSVICSCCSSSLLMMMKNSSSSSSDSPDDSSDSPSSSNPPSNSSSNPPSNSSSSAGLGGSSTPEFEYDNTIPEEQPSSSSNTSSGSNTSGGKGGASGSDSNSSGVKFPPDIYVMFADKDKKIIQQFKKGSYKTIKSPGKAIYILVKDGAQAILYQGGLKTKLATATKNVKMSTNNAIKVDSVIVK